MIITRHKIPDVVSIEPKKFQDSRGFFSETFRDEWLTDFAPGLSFRQDNHAFSESVGTLRGLHFQYGQSVQAKLVRCVKGAILDVAVDIRHGSPTFGQHVALELSEENWRQLFIPHGFAHGYCTLMPNTEVIYKVDNLYDPSREGSIRWSDPKLGIYWGIEDSAIETSEKDANTDLLDESPMFFSYSDSAPAFRAICHDVPIKSETEV